MDINSPLMVIGLVLLGAFGAAMTYLGCTLPIGQPAKPEEPTPEDRPPLVPKQVLVLKQGEVEDFLRVNEMHVSIDHCFQFISSMRDYKLQRVRLDSMLGRATRLHPGMAYVVRMGP